MLDSRLIFIHDREGSSQEAKATFLRGLFPDILTPDFRGSLKRRMGALGALVGETRGWTMIGSSFGGLMAALFTCQHPEQVDRLVLLAPELNWPDFAAHPPDPVSVPTVVYHGSRDGILPLNIVRRLAEPVFLNLTFNEVDDDHGLYKTIPAIDWPQLLGRETNR